MLRLEATRYSVSDQTGEHSWGEMFLTVIRAVLAMSSINPTSGYFTDFCRKWLKTGFVFDKIADRMI